MKFPNWIAVAATTFLFCLSLSGALPSAAAQQPIDLASDPDLSPDGQRLAFAWRGDIWIVATKGGAARQLTSSADNDSQPKFSPDGKRIAFVSDRLGNSPQVFVVPVSGGLPTQLTFHSDGYSLMEWAGDGDALLVAGNRDHYWRDAARFFLITAKPHSPEQLVFDAAGENGRLSKNGQQLLFTREGVAWWRKGYRGSQASQVWHYDMEQNQFTQLCNDESGARSPLWDADGKGFYYVSGESGSFNLWHRQIDGSNAKQLTRFEDDTVVMPCISGDGQTVVFRHLFDLYSFRPGEDQQPQKIRLICRADQVTPPTRNVTLNSASEVAFSADGLEVAFVAGGDVFVMDTILREPRQITDTPEEESSVAFAPDGESILFASDTSGQSDLWRATRKDSGKYWWLNDEFQLDRLTEDGAVDGAVKFSPDGKQIAWVKGRGDLWMMQADGSDQKVFLDSWNQPEFDWSPDSKWLTWAVSDNDFNSDIFVAPVDGSVPPLNISRHPDNDGNPVWSPDGKFIAFTGRRFGEESDIFFVHLQKKESEIEQRDRKMKEALEALEKARKDKPGKGKPDDPDAPKNSSDKPGQDQPEEPAKKEPAADPSGTSPASDEPPLEQKESAEGKPPADDKDKIPEVIVDADGIHERIVRVSIPNTGEGGLFWSHDSKKLAFTANIDGKPGTYTIEPPAELTPKLLNAKTGRQARWIREGNKILWLVGGNPESLDGGGKAESYTFRALKTIDNALRYQAGFDLAWRAMRDGFYDGNLNNRNWDEIRRKYVDAAKNAPDDATFASVVQMMLGELNGSHLGFFAGGRPGRGGGGAASAEERSWNESTAHFGLRFDPKHKGPGLLVRDVIYRSPAWSERSRVEAGETVLAVDGTEVDPGMDLTTVLNGPLPRDVVLKVSNAAGESRDVTIRPITFSAARGLLYEHWVRGNQAKVREASGDTFGYIHIRGMDMGSFYDFERDLFAIASGKEGLVIDVRENGGGSTADHLLTILTQPTHAITVPRDGGPGYPHDRMVYATWNKPVIVLCNQNSFSNAEIFSHAIKTLKRGKLVGVPTAGGVISTGGTSIMDLGFLRMPFRGWYLAGDGEDMELHGAEPDFVIWPHPGDMMQGTDRQLEKAIEVLQEDVKSWKARPQPKLQKASERPGRK